MKKVAAPQTKLSTLFPSYLGETRSFYHVSVCGAQDLQQLPSTSLMQLSLAALLEATGSWSDWNRSWFEYVRIIMWVLELMHLYHSKSIVFPCFFPFACLKALDLPKKKRCEKLPTDSGRKRRQVGDGSRFETTPCSQPSTAHGDVGLFNRSVRSCKIHFRACLSSAELQT